MIDGVSQTLAGEFEFDNDAAWFQFLLGSGTFTLTGATTSAAAGFDPILRLFGPEGAPVPYLTSDGGVSTSAVSGEIDADIQLPQFTLTGGLIYTLTLSQFGPLFGNFPKDTLEEGFELDAPEFRCFFNVGDPAAPCLAGAPDLFGGQSASFSLDLIVTSADTMPVPEPGTLSLMALGMAGALLRRRRARHHTNTL